MMKKWNVIVGEPKLVVDSGYSYEELGWGPYQFPLLLRTVDGGIYASWEMHHDEIINNVTLPGAHDAVSYDDGETWVVPAPQGTLPISNVALQDGFYLSGIGGRGCFAVDWLAKYPDKRCEGVPSYLNNGYPGALYTMEGISEFPTDVTVRKINPATGECRSVQGNVIWKNGPMDVLEDGEKRYVTPFSKLFGLQNGAVVKKGDALFICIYGRGVDCKTGKAQKYSHLFSCFVFRSDDDGLTWHFLSQVAMNDRAYETARRGYLGRTQGVPVEGFCEPMMTVLPNGNFAMLMRTGHKMPSYITYSADDCKTWSEPAWFDRMGVMPKLLTLGCGATVAAYGRPGLYIRVAADPAAAEWEQPIQIALSRDPETGNCNSCSYARLLPLDDRSFLLVYSDFYHPNGQGKSTKVLQARRVTLVSEEATRKNVSV